MEDYLQVGILTKPHGLHGEIKVYPTTDDNHRFKKLKVCYIQTKDEKKLVHVVSCKFFKQMVILKFQEFNSIREVESLKQCELLVNREQAVKLEEDEYFIADIIGIKVMEEDGIILGELKEVLSTQANDVYLIEGSDGREILIPAIRQCILNVNINESSMTVRLMKGMTE